MKSIKPGRGPSFMGGIGSVAAVIFGIIWTIAAASMGAPFFFPLFGAVFIVVGIVQAVYNFKNATGENRYSTFDITDESEEADPLNERFGKRTSQPLTYTGNDGDDGNDGRDSDDENGSFCPYCGSSVKPDYEFCKKCGKKI